MAKWIGLTISAGVVVAVMTLGCSREPSGTEAS